MTRREHLLVVMTLGLMACGLSGVACLALIGLYLADWPTFGLAWAACGLYWCAAFVAGKAEDALLAPGE